ncbi:FBP domain-containing protein [Microbacterium sp. STF-2]|uniref:FBP domain-containing protein n=1 Tax=Microbacterium sp. STF-2 TaxID=3031132 RepID=UPI002AFE030A|nr:FBP domain-containing protein [Microbacterium sp. STF-2]MEA1263161.1 FBP domain-containing protein [Microbacterium sp. STF-2]
MQPRSGRELRAALLNVSESVRRTVRVPKRLPLGWGEADYLGWRDPSAPQRGYIIIEESGRLKGIMLTHARLSARPSRAVMCALCRIPRRFEQVVLFTGTSEGADRSLSSRGSYLCADLDCNVRVNALRPSSPLEPSPEELVAQRRAELRERSHAFVAEVLARAPITARR